MVPAGFSSRTQIAAEPTLSIVGDTTGGRRQEAEGQERVEHRSTNAQQHSTDAPKGDGKNQRRHQVLIDVVDLPRHRCLAQVRIGACC